MTEVLTREYWEGVTQLSGVMLGEPIDQFNAPYDAHLRLLLAIKYLENYA